MVRIASPLGMWYRNLFVLCVLRTSRGEYRDNSSVTTSAASQTSLNVADTLTKTSENGSNRHNLAVESAVEISSDGIWLQM